MVERFDTFHHYSLIPVYPVPRLTLTQGTIFKRFYREDAVHDVDGIGIGLYLAREIVTLQGGYIRVVSEVGKGSTFSVFLLRK